MFKNNLGINFKGEIHELVDESINEINGKIETENIFVHHYSEKKGMDYKKWKTQKYRELCEKKIIKQPNNPKAYFELAQSYRTDNFFELAKQNLLKAIELKEDYTEAYQVLGVIYIELGEDKKALDILNKALEFNKSYAETYFSLGVVYSKLKKNELAAKFIEKGLKIHPNDVHALTNLGAIYEKIGEYSKSVKILNKALVLNPLNPRAHYNIGLTFIKKGNINNTIKAFNNAIRFGYKDKDKLIRFIENVNKLSKL